MRNESRPIIPVRLRSGPPSERGARSGRAAGLGGLVGLGLLLACTGLQACNRHENTYAPPQPPEVTVAHPVHRPVTRYLEYTGTTEAYQTVDLRARVPGFLDRVDFQAGAQVSEGDVLFNIDPRVYEAAVARAAADLETREAALRLAELTLTRTTEAIKGGAASTQELDRAVAERDQAKAQVALAEAALQSARLDLEFCEVKAPIAGSAPAGRQRCWRRS
ncbi:MAG: efflux RND transporter periplasmic adaptor subunit [Phycisphaerales bacterium]|nr:efflux RND transporter periplasmic adaptor subunit [Phycisphaerales bacterium]